MEVTAHVVPHPYTKFEVRSSSRSEDMADFPSRRVNRLGDTLIFDFSTSKWDRSPVSLASFLPILSLLRLFILDLGSGSGQTDNALRPTL